MQDAVAATVKHNQHNIATMSKLIHIDQDYKQWIQDLKSRYRRSQIKASVKVNYEVLSYYWQLGFEYRRVAYPTLLKS